MNEVRDFTREDFPWLLALNAANEIETGPLDAPALARMQAAALQAVAIGERAFMLAFREGADYASPNYLWFSARFSVFAYVDRIVVARAARGAGLGRKLYEHLFQVCAASGLPFVGCEVNIDPPNPVSDRFHAALGFAEIGRARLENGKHVGYLRRMLSLR